MFTNMQKKINGKDCRDRRDIYILLKRFMGRRLQSIWRSVYREWGYVINSFCQIANRKGNMEVKYLILADNITGKNGLEIWRRTG